MARAVPITSTLCAKPDCSTEKMHQMQANYCKFSTRLSLLNAIMQDSANATDTRHRSLSISQQDAACCDCNVYKCNLQAALQTRHSFKATSKVDPQPNVAAHAVPLWLNFTSGVATATKPRHACAATPHFCPCITSDSVCTCRTVIARCVMMQTP